METTCGIFFICGRELLICHATDSNPTNWSIPKGLCEKEESKLQTAVREFKEETGIDISKYSDKILPIGEQLYKTKKKNFCGFVSICKNKKPTDFVCLSLTPKGKPEVDIIEWVSIPVAVKLIHEAQKTLFKKFLDDIKRDKINDVLFSNFKKLQF